jgi:hypothetical protein
MLCSFAVSRSVLGLGCLLLATSAMAVVVQTYTFDDATAPQAVDRMFLNGVQTSCGNPGGPMLAGRPSMYSYQTQTLYNNGPARCVQAGIRFPSCDAANGVGVNGFGVNVYSPRVTPDTRTGDTYLGAGGISQSIGVSFSFVAPANAPIVFWIDRTVPVGTMGITNCDYTIFADVLDLAPGPPLQIPVVEYYYQPWNAYFVTSIPNEISLLDSGAFGAWARTGYQFNTYDSAHSLPTSSIGVCRFFNVSFAPKSAHFYALQNLGCEDTKRNFPDWQLESSAAFYMFVPDTDGNCQAGSIPVYRLYNNGMGGAPNHRFTTNATVRSQMISAGWVPEGNGIGVGFCSPQ